MFNYFVKLRFVEQSFLLVSDNFDIKSDHCIYFNLNGLCISVMRTDYIEFIYHYENGNYVNKVYDFENVPFPEVM